MSLLGPGPHVGARASDLLDGRLSGAVEVSLRAHIGSCRECAAAVHREQQVRALLRAARSDEPRPTGDLMAGLMALAAGQQVYEAQQAQQYVLRSSPPTSPSTRRGTSVLMGAAVLGTVSLASAGVLGVSALPGPATAALGWGGAATASFTQGTPTVQTASTVVRTGLGAVVLTGAGIEGGDVDDSP
jgi:hypothetical protein